MFANCRRYELLINRAVSQCLRTALKKKIGLLKERIIFCVLKGHIILIAISSVPNKCLFPLSNFREF